MAAILFCDILCDILNIPNRRGTEVNWMIFLVHVMRLGHCFGSAYVEMIDTEQKFENYNISPALGPDQHDIDYCLKDKAAPHLQEMR